MVVLDTPANSLEIKNAILRVKRIEATNVTVSSELTYPPVIDGGTTISGDFGVSGNTTVSSNLTIGSDLTVSSNLEIGTANLFVDKVSGNVGIGTNSPVAKLHVNGDFYTPGATIQTIVENVHKIFLYNGLDNHIELLDIMIRPKFANSKILLQWTINGEAHHNSVYRIYRGDTLIGYNTEDPSVNHWNGISPAHYDRDENSTPNNVSLSWVDTPNTTDPIIYKVYLHDSGGGSTTQYLNRTFGSGGASNYENGVSYKMATELAQ